VASGFGAACLLLGFFSIDPDVPSSETDRRTDWLGAFLVTAGLVLVVFILSDGEIVGWSKSCYSDCFSFVFSMLIRFFIPDIIALTVTGVSFLIIFILWEYYLEQVQENPNAVYSMWTPPPLMKPSIWSRANGRFAVMMAIAFLNWSAFLR
jgi:hypothetical protein